MRLTKKGRRFLLKACEGLVLIGLMGTIALGLLADTAELGTWALAALCDAAVMGAGILGGIALER